MSTGFSRVAGSFFNAFGMIRPALMLFLLLPNLVRADNFEGYRKTTLDAVFDDWNARTKKDGPGISFSNPDNIRFVITMREAPKACNTAVLETVLQMADFSELLKQVKISHCLAFTSAKGRSVIAYVQDILVPGLMTDVKIGSAIEIYVNLLAYQVNSDRSRNSPVMLLSRFDTK
jgi:hypothetical protein